MRIFVMPLIGMSFMFGSLYEQTYYELKGLVRDENSEPLTGASVILYPVEKGTISDINGNFLISYLPEGEYEIEISFVGYETVTDTLSIVGNRTYNAQLDVSSLSLKEVIVTDNYSEIRKKEESLNMEIVNDDYLMQNQGGSLMSSLERLPGITTIDIGSGQSKPVVRGLGFNRVLVIENGIKHEAQQWGADHGLEIDQYAVNSIEIIKGPSSLKYGSDAIGGVINLKNRHLPELNSIGAKIDLSGKTNNDLLGTSVSINGRKNWFFADLRATKLDYGDYKVPVDSVDIYSYRAALYKNHLRNTAGKEKDFHFSFGMIQKRFQSKLLISSVNNRSGFFANAHGLEPRNVDTELYDRSNRDILYPYQKVHHFKVINTSQYQWESLLFESNLGYQRNFRQEWSQYISHGYMPSDLPYTLSFNPDLERQFDKEVYSGNVKFTYRASEKADVDFGLSAEYQDNQIDGRGFVIPAFHQFNLEGYFIAKYAISDKSAIQSGIRYDYGMINTCEYYDWFLSPIIEDGDTTMQYLQRAVNIDRNFSNFTWSAGYNYYDGKWSYKVNIGKSFRMPVAKELAANGVNYHRFSYEVGNPDLSPEESYQLDAGVEYTFQRLALGASPFVNYFSNYIYLNPTAEHDRLYGNGNQVFYYTQSEVFRFGGEIHSHFQLYKYLQLGLVGEFVYSEQLSGEKKGFSLPFSPPASAIFNIKYQQQKTLRILSSTRILLLEDAYISIDCRLTAAQNNIVPPEDSTDGYQLVSLSLGSDIIIGKQSVNISLQIQNLFNTKYFNHTSYYRLINVPEVGRNLVVNISIPFSGKIH